MPTATATPDTRSQLCSAVLAGPSDRRAPRALRDRVLAERKEQLLVLRHALATSAPSGFPAGCADRAWHVLVAADDADPDSTADVLLSPPVGLWLVRALRRLALGLTAGPRARPDLGALSAVAAASALRAGVPFQLDVPVAHGVVTLPTVGWFTLPPGPADDRPTHLPLRHDGGRFALDTPPSAPEAAFQRLDAHRCGTGEHPLTAVLEDVDPHRAFTDPVPPAPLDETGRARWTALLDRAWELLERCAPDHAAELSGGPLTLVPPTGAEHDGSSSAAAFGAVALPEAATATELAELLVRERQHGKLSALTGLVRLHDADATPSFHAPWRDDPRPLGAVLHGIYALTGVAELWHGLRAGLPADQRADAEYAFALRRAQVRAAMGTVLNAPELTAEGRALLAACAHRLDACADQPAVEVVRAVDRVVAEHRALWRIRHVRPYPADVSCLTGAWLERRPKPFRLQVRTEVHPTGADLPEADPSGAGRAPARAALLRALATGERMPVADEVDAACARGDVRTALAGYRKRLLAEPDDLQAWAGLALASRREALLAVPEVVKAVHADALARTGTPPDPLLLADWVGER
ncbi:MULTISPECIES: aKG-HExxH-type peptide beta-hydroxylase [Actinosynnema]|uniref:aKG-HExxH-type peptide beta-hydroxylase n=1 Tax=Actinosynnema TaxID=40566 RepID=UPI0020A4D9BA|nr:HEXXH motif-containing putative peptide modification protein [Actinosynnema pretiosum]MCP2098673.1 HEXXH motif-containing protein [Actinosynnema pretiosum]